MRQIWSRHVGRATDGWALRDVGPRRTGRKARLAIADVGDPAGKAAARPARKDGVRPPSLKARETADEPIFRCPSPLRRSLP
jgi:hypothetical protein